MTHEQKVARYRDEVLPNMILDDLLNSLEQAVRTDDGYGSGYEVIQLIRAEIKQRLA